MSTRKENEYYINYRKTCDWKTNLLRYLYRKESLPYTH